jgi:hypothetical protein
LRIFEKRLAGTVLLACGCVNCGSSGKDVKSGPGVDAAAGMQTADASVMTMDAASASVIVTGPATGGMGQPSTTSVVDLGAPGYSEKEFFFEGDATAYALQGEPTMDGKWALVETTEQHFKTRLLVRRPLDAKKFNGTVVIEWLNVSGGADADPGFIYNWAEIMREGYVWIGVSAQAQGVVGGGFAFPIPGLVPLLQYDPERYGSLNHPGDDYSYDVYTRAAQVVRGGVGGVDVLEGLRPKFLIGYGESQSAGRLVSYINGVHPLVAAFDGFFVHSRGDGGVPFGTEAAAQPLGGGPVRIRDDLGDPVFQFETETDVIGSLGFLAARQPDTDMLRTWEVAGTSHIDAYTLGLDETGAGNVLGCNNPNDGPQHYVIRAALRALHLWISEGSAPVKGEPLMTDPSGNPVTDEHGNTRGGVRTPDVDVPIATLSGLPASDPSALSNPVCFLFGSTTPFTHEKLMELYPSHEDYVTKVMNAARATREAGFILSPEEQEIVATAESAPVPN